MQVGDLCVIRKESDIDLQMHAGTLGIVIEVISRNGSETATMYRISIPGEIIVADPHEVAQIKSMRPS